MQHSQTSFPPRPSLLRRTIARVGACLVLALIAACGGGGAGGAPAIEIQVITPVGVVNISPSGRTTFEYRDLDETGQGTTTLYADPDANPATTADWIVIEANRPEQDGAIQTASWDAEGIAVGTYRIVAQLTSSTGVVTTSPSPGVIRISNFGGVTDNTGPGNQGGAAVDVAPNGSATEATNFDQEFDGRFVTDDFDGIAASIDAVLQSKRPNGDVEWEVHLGGRDTQQITKVSRNDTIVYAGGVFETELLHRKLGPPPTNTSLLDPVGILDGFVLRMSGIGTIEWRRRIGGAGATVNVRDVELCPDGGVLVVGAFTGTIEFPTATNAGNVPTLTAVGSDGFVAKYMAAGALAFTPMRLSGPGNDGANDATVMPDCSFDVVGDTEGDLDVNGTTGPASNGGMDAFCAEFQSNGTPESVDSFGGAMDDSAKAVVALTNGDRVIAGDYQGTMTVETETLMSNMGSVDSFLVQHRSDGTFRSASGSGGVGDDNLIAADATTDGGFLLTGTFTDDGGGVPEQQLSAIDAVDAYVAKLSGNCVTESLTHLGGSALDATAAVAALPDGAFIVAGRYEVDITIGVDDPGSQEFLVAPGDLEDGFFARFNASGQLSPATLLYRFDGTFGGQRLGGAVAVLGDVNGDGCDDFVIGENRDASVVRVYSGKTGTVLGTLLGEMPDEALGATHGSISTITDQNGDGVDDILVGAPKNDGASMGAETGAVHVYSGATRALLYRVRGTGPGQRFGTYIAQGGDYNSDAVLDFVVGAPSDPALATVGYAVSAFGNNMGLGAPIFSPSGAPDDGFGVVSFVGDANGDGVSDIPIGAPFADDNGIDAGLLRIVSRVDGSEIFTLFGQSAGNEFGTTFDRVGDQNGDGMPDVAVGAPGTAGRSGAVHLFNRSGTLIRQITGTPASDFGAVVVGAGDINGDGVLDVLVGAPFDDSGNVAPRVNGGAMYLYSGVNSDLLLSWKGSGNEQRVGFSMAGRGDLNGDGAPDFIVGAPGTRISGNANAGTVKVYSGSQPIGP